MTALVRALAVTSALCTALAACSSSPSAQGVQESASNVPPSPRASEGRAPPVDAGILRDYVDRASSAVRTSVLVGLGRQSFPWVHSTTRPYVGDATKQTTVSLGSVLLEYNYKSDSGSGRVTEHVTALAMAANSALQEVRQNLRSCAEVRAGSMADDARRPLRLLKQSPNELIYSVRLRDGFGVSSVRATQCLLTNVTTIAPSERAAKPLAGVFAGTALSRAAGDRPCLPLRQ